MMNKLTIQPRSPWEDRWAQPTLKQLLDPQKESYRSLLESLIEQVSKLEHVQQSLVWYGPAWKWTLEFTLRDERGHEMDKLVYIVPNPATPLVSVPLRSDSYQVLSSKRLSKYVRDGLRSAKCAVELHWATWTPTSASDVEGLVDLVKRKYKLYLNGHNGHAESN